jgi:hypothetical protein
MHGPTRFPRSTLGARSVSRSTGTGAARRPTTIEDRPSALNRCPWLLRGTRGWGCRLRHRWWRGGLVNGSRTGLRHDHAARNRGRRRNWGCDLGWRSYRAGGNRRRRVCHHCNRSNRRLVWCGGRRRPGACYHSRGRCETHLGARDCTRDRRPADTRRNCWRPCFRADDRRLCDNGSCGRLGRDGGCRRRRGNHNPRLLPRLGNDPSWRRRWRGWNSLTLTAEVWPELPRGTGARNTRTRRTGARRTYALAGGNRRGWGDDTGWRCTDDRTLHCRWRSGNGCRRSCGHGNGGRPGYLGLSGRSKRRPLGYGCGFIFSLLDRFEHVAGLRDPRPVDLLLRLALYLRRAGAVLAAAAVEVLADPLCFIAFQRA